MKKVVALMIIGMFLVILTTGFIYGLTKEQRKTISQCKVDCRIEKKASTLECKSEYRSCKLAAKEIDDRRERRAFLKECRQERKTCYKETRETYKTCRTDCKEIFTRTLLQDQTTCEENGGFFHELCNGPYFDIVCTPKKYCLCDGVHEYQCPANHECTHDISVRLPRRNTVAGFKDFLGNPLGDIGICNELPVVPEDPIETEQSPL